MGKSGALNVTESGSEVVHDPKQVDVPTSPEQYLARFKESFELNILERPSPNELVFEMVRTDPSFVNALRRILMAEIPTVAIERVYITKNSSIIHDEVLAHRMGLVPIMADARLMQGTVDPAAMQQSEEEVDPDDCAPNDRNTIVFRMDAHCTHAEARAASVAQNKRSGKKQAPKNEQEMDELVAGTDTDGLEQVAKDASSKQAYQFPKDRPFTKSIYSSELEWIPQGDQQFRFPQVVSPIHSDILLAKLRPGQSISIECHAIKGIGKDHAKFSPVATASYRLLPHVEILEPVFDELAEELVHLYEPGVFELVPVTAQDPPGTRQKAAIKNPYACTMSRNFMRNETLAKSIRITRIPDHFIFSIESVGMYSPAVLLAEALRVLQKKCIRVMDLTDAEAARS
eukprot:CAMPEP_0198144072 /NCGR_PEP_ID=MMETSP1443-20131203/12780_1 /TAXON_ID=186043 /ORGANISM="Entomoneis sp., Strain CCMP2396" /LENGTH=400 /DNA_ID=CAMNT_0043807411 /DNA_START=85 /DNA_END=1287 /DNA_ORIENTATION=-